MLRFAYVATSLLALSVPAAHAQQQGGVIKIATIGEPASLDPMMSATDLVGMISQHIFETLFTFDSKWNVTPLLAQSMPEVSSNGTIYTIKLRQDIKFHDGREMMANDVVASLKRWLDVASRGKQTAVYIKSVEKTANDTVTITLTQPYAPLLSLLAFNNSAAVIMPSDALTMPLKEVIGTGPYKLKEHKADQYIQLIRFDDYKPRSEKADGFGGARIAKADEILFAPLPDANTRIEAAISGQYDYVDSLPVESYQRLEQGKDKPVLLDHFGWPIFVMNNKDGPLKSAKIRKAIQLALNEEDMLAAGFGDPKFYAAEPAMYPKGYAWHTTTGTENYNLADPEKAKALLDEAGYDGTPIRILTSRQYEFHYKMAQVAQMYLEQAGFTVDLQVSDWATMIQRNKRPELWDVFITHSPFLPEPALNFILSKSSGGWWETPEKEAALDAFNRATSQEERVKLWGELQKLIFEQAPIIKIGDFSALSASSPKLADFNPSPWPYFWNVQVQN
ncbi:ABC transporter substrate-binding protein [Ochrobactrum vermis]|uniref:ABC transporter substrate-binding protein n=1 Tax=Ochrobactrum vermis TaxID=1827297 RepID=A0ABU8PKL9_9HYPH|nr:ABC transporter substrate-binding protein [Ochrobactrum vermis]